MVKAMTVDGHSYRPAEPCVGELVRANVIGPIEYAYTSRARILHRLLQMLVEQSVCYLGDGAQANAKRLPTS